MQRKVWCYPTWTACVGHICELLKDSDLPTSINHRTKEWTDHLLTKDQTSAQDKWSVCHSLGQHHISGGEVANRFTQIAGHPGDAELGLEACVPRGTAIVGQVGKGLGVVWYRLFTHQ